MNRARQAGFTLIELLIGMGIMGVLFVLITNWQVNTLQITTRTNALSRSLADLNDMTGYLGDRVRAAARIRVSTGSDMSMNGVACSVTLPCLAVVLPEYTATGIVSKYNLYVYRMGSRTALNASDRVTDAWADSNVQVLREYRSLDTGSTPANCVLGTGETLATATSVNCQSMSSLMDLAVSPTVSFSGMSPYLVTDYLTPASATFTPFAYDSATRTLTLTIQYRQQVLNKVVTLPASGNYTLAVQARNVP